jgi:integrase/recombinase XerD
VRRQLEDRFKSGGVPTEVNPEERITIDSAIKLFLTSLRQSGKQTPEVLDRYEREAARLRAFCERKGKYFPAELTTALMLQYRETWADLYQSDMTRRFVQQRLRRFLRFCFGEGWLERLPQLSSIEAQPQEANPLEPEQFEAALKAIPEVLNDELAKRTRGVMLLQRYGGLAVADATTLERERLQKKNGNYIIAYYRRKVLKQKHLVTVPIQPEIAQEILKLANKEGKYLFWNGNSHWRTAAVEMMKNIKNVFKKAFGQQTEFSSHNLRDTAGCEWLKAGVPLEVVSEMLGHKSIITTEKHYKRLVDSLREKHVEAVVNTWQRKKEGASA